MKWDKHHNEDRWSAVHWNCPPGVRMEIIKDRLDGYIYHIKLPNGDLYPPAGQGWARSWTAMTNAEKELERWLREG